MATALNIGVAGCGIGGLAAAALLAQNGHDVTVYDRFEAPAPVGSGLILQPVGQSVLAALGVRAPLIKHGAKIARMRGHEVRSGRTILDVRYEGRHPGRVGIGMHRTTLFDMLYGAAVTAGARIETSSMVSATESAVRSRRILFDNRDPSPVFDLVIDASGAGSRLSSMRTHSLPFGALWATVDWSDATGLAPADLTQAYSHANHMAGILPIGTMTGSTTQKAALFWSLRNQDFAKWKADGLAAWQDRMVRLWPEITPFATQITSREMVTMALYTHGTFRRRVGDRLVHIGDAAQRTSPQLGQGANMALLDAYALALALGRFEGFEALRRFDAMRRHHVHLYQALSRIFTPLYQSDSRVLPVVRDYVFAPMSQIPLVQNMLANLVSGSFVAPLRGTALPEPG